MGLCVNLTHMKLKLGGLGTQPSLVTQLRQSEGQITTCKLLPVKNFSIAGPIALHWVIDPVIVSLST